MKYKIREMNDTEYPLLRDFLYESIYIPKGENPPPKTIIESKELQVYIADFGKEEHDIAFAAEIDKKIIGAVWARIMDDYGHIDEYTPSFAISVFREYRGLGIGTALLEKLLSALKAKGYAQVSLSVQKENYAVKMYQRAGFKLWKERGEEYIMAVVL